MRTNYVGCVALVCTLATVAFSAAQPPAKSKSAKLPFGWSRIGLSDEQKKKATAIITEANAKVADLERQIADIRTKERSALAAILTDAQKQELQKVLANKAGLEPTTKETKPTPKP